MKFNDKTYDKIFEMMEKNEKFRILVCKVDWMQMGTFGELQRWDGKSMHMGNRSLCSILQLCH